MPLAGVSTRAAVPVLGRPGLWEPAASKHRTALALLRTFTVWRRTTDGTAITMNALRRADLGLLAVLSVCLLVIYPFFSWPGMPGETDAELHIVRTAELAHLLRGGVVYPRWAPDFYHGYGYPLFNYYSPLTYYLGAAFMLLPGVDAVLAVKLVFVLGLLAAGLGMYALVRRLWGVRPALVASAAYVYAPYIQFVDPHARGDLAESFALGIFPWVLWAFTEPAGLDTGRGSGSSAFWSGRRVCVAAGLLAALICTHNLMALVLTAVLGAWVVWQLCCCPSSLASGPPRRTLLVSLAAPFLLGMALSAFFWLPVLLEWDAVQLGNLVSQGGHFDFRNHFLSLSELFRPTSLLDLGATEPQYHFSLGVAQWLLGLAGAASLFWRRSPGRPAAVFYALLSIALVLLVLPVSAPIWERVPLMPLLQFPWRLVGPLSACLAVLAGAAMAAFDGIRSVGWAAAGVVALILLLAMPLTYPEEWPAEFGPTDPAGILAREQEGRWLGTTSGGDFLPIDVRALPPANSQVLESYRAGGPVDRVNRATLPAGTSVTLVGERPLSWTFQVDGDEGFVFRLFHFFFPGWTATVDGRPVSIEPAKPDGLVTFRVPSGQRQVSVSFRDTPARRVAWGVSGVALVLCILVAVRFPRSDEAIVPRPGRPLFYRVTAVALAVLVFKVGVADPLGWFRLRSQGLEVERADQTVFYQVGEEVALIGYDWRPATPGEAAEVTLYWKALRPVPTNYQVFVHLRDESGAVVSQSDRLNPGDYPARRWPLDQYVRDPHRLALPAEMPSGEYRLAVGLWLMAEGERLPVRDVAGRELGDSVFLVTVSY